MSPDRKVASGALGGALSVIIIWLLNIVGEVDVPPEVASAFTVIFTFGTSYFTNE